MRAHLVLRSENRQAPRVFDKQFRCSLRKPSPRFTIKRWQVELFFKWIKQNPHQAFYGTVGERRENANLDGGLRLCARRHHLEGTAAETSRSITFLQILSSPLIRKKSSFSAPSRTSTPKIHPRNPITS